MTEFRTSLLDERRAHIHDDLRGLITGDLIFDAVGRAPYAIDASLYEIDPLGVVVPRTTEDVVATIRYAAESGIPIHARGAGTGLAGESLGPGLVLDFSRYLRRIISVRSDHVVVQPGVVLSAINAQLAPLGRRIGPDPSGASSCTIGGLIAGNAAGARSLRYGTTADAVIDLEVVFANGETANLALEPWPTEFTEPATFKEAVLRRVALHLKWHADLIARTRPRSPRNRAGYALDSLATAEGVRLDRLIVGSEGTLALITQARLRTVPVPAAQAAVLLPFNSLAEGAERVLDCLPFEPAACDLYDWRRLNLARDADPTLRSWIDGSAEAALVVLFEGDTIEEVRRRAHDLGTRILRLGGLSSKPTETTRLEDCNRLLRLREIIQPHLMRSRNPARPVPIVEDAAVPPDRLLDFLNAIQTIMKSYDVNWIFHAHAGCGQTHVRPFLNLASPADVAKLEGLATEVHEAALALGGTISGEHGCGLARSQFIRRQYGELEPVLREIKYAFDPQNLLNPGKIVGADPHLLTRNLRRWPEPDSEGRPTGGGLPVLNEPLFWPETARAELISACHGCGDCRSLEPGLRMCPTFRALRTEDATPRAHVNRLRQIATGVLDPRLFGTEELRATADACVHCHLCRSECPAGIDVSSLMIEVKAAYVENHGLAPSDWTLSHIGMWASWASRLPALSNRLLGSRWARYWIERFFGLSRHRIVPRVQRRPFLKRAEASGLTVPRPQAKGPRVAYFVDLFANYFDPELGEAVVALLQHAGVNVYVPRRQVGCGMPALVTGDLDRARHLLRINLKALGDAVRDGYTIVCSEPTAALMFRHEALRLTDDLDAGLVADRTMDVGQYLEGLAAIGGLPAFTDPVSARVGYHQPCHLRALGIGTPGLDLLRTIPGLEVEFIDRGCSGIAGIFGLSRRHFRTSLRAGRALRNRLKDPDIEVGATECGTCRMQMEQGIAKRTIHPIKLLALSYGFLPELRQRLKEPKPARIIS